MRTESSAAVAELSKTDCAGILFSEGLDLLQSRNVQAALACFDSAQQRGYEITECAAARWDCWMLLGDFERAWVESDLIASKGIRDANQFWDGSSWHGKQVMLRCLHGLGDTIQFIRFAPLLRRTCRTLFVQTHPQIVSLIAGVAGVDHAFTWASGATREELDWDMQMEVIELPRAFRTKQASIPASVPYLQIPQERILWGSQWFQEQRSLRVGISWEAGPWDPMRSLELQQLMPLLESGSCSFYGLQKGRDTSGVPGSATVYNLEAHACDIRDTAALILNLDLVITVDTMTAHLAGALGKPVWILLPFRADWRWMLERTDTPWYPTARLFRQREYGDWSAPVREMQAALAELARGREYLQIESGCVPHLSFR